MNIGIAGVGMVGGTLRKHFPQAMLYDPTKGHNEDLYGCDIVFICVPTPSNEDGYDLSHIKDVLSKLSEDTIAVIRSTVLPGTTIELAHEFTHLNIVFNPEFLSEETALLNFRNPEIQIVGYTRRLEDAKKVLSLLPKGDEELICDSTTAETIKMSRNLISAAKVVVMNEMYDQVKADYDLVEVGLQALERRGSHHFKPIHKGGRGAGGKCLPKELNAFANASDGSTAIKAIRDKNEWLLKTFR